jgi:hypothetical protein
MPKNAGDSVSGSTDTIGYEDSDDSTTEGEAVAIASGDIEPADSDAGHELLGVRSGNRAAGDNHGVHVSGIVIAEVEGSVTAGDDLDIGNATDGTTGQLATSSGGPAHALSDAGGSWKGASLGANEAAVLIR